MARLQPMGTLHTTAMRRKVLTSGLCGVVRADPEEDQEMKLIVSDLGVSRRSWARPSESGMLPHREVNLTSQVGVSCPNLVDKPFPY